MDCHIRHGKTLPPSIPLISTFALTPFPREAVGQLPLLLGGECPLIILVSRCQCLRQYNVCVGLALHPNWEADVGGGVKAHGTTPTPGVPKNMGSKLLHPQKHKNMTEVNGESSFFFI